jgi:hypothetical protein
MNVTEYETVFAELNLTKEQCSKICYSLEKLMTQAERQEHKIERLSNSAAAQRAASYYGGKAAGLNVAWKFFANTLQETDELDDDQTSH